MRDGSVTVTDEQGETLFVIGAPWMYDAAGGRGLGGSVVEQERTFPYFTLKRSGARCFNHEIC